MQGKVFVFTGEIPGLTRERAAEQVRFAGGIVREEVTADTSFVVAGDGAGRKLEDARKLGVNVLSPQNFARLLEH